MINPRDIHLVYHVHPQNDGTGTVNRHLAGKFVIHNGEVHHLSDYHGVLSHIPEGKLGPRAQTAIERLMHSSYYQVVSRAELNKQRQGMANIHVELPESSGSNPAMPVAGAQPAQPIAPMVVTKPPSVFEYHRVGMDKPHVLEFSGGKAALDGNPLEDHHIRKIFENAKNGLATIRYRQNKMAKSLEDRLDFFLLDLKKGEGIGDSLSALRELVAKGHLKQEHYDTVRKELYNDEMIPSIGNKRAFKEHLANEGRGGVHIMLDANDFKSINDELSHEHGDHAIKAMGQAMRNAVDKTVGPDKAKVHRFGGDEFHIHVPTHDHAAVVLRQLRNELESVPAIGGTHKLSMSAGIGTDTTSADRALNEGAKTQKKLAIAQIGGDPEARVGKVRAPHSLYVHSAVPGAEGPVPMSHEQLPLKPPPVKTAPVEPQTPTLPGAVPSQT